MKVSFHNVWFKHYLIVYDNKPPITMENSIRVEVKPLGVEEEIILPNIPDQIGRRSCVKFCSE